MKLGPTFSEMRDPSTIEEHTRSQALAAKKEEALDPINLYNITWRGPKNEIYYAVVPHELTGVEAPIVVIHSHEFPTGSHKVGASYSVLAELIVTGQVVPEEHILVWPSTGNYGVGGAWVGGRMGGRGIVVLPEGMSKERFELIGHSEPR